MNRTPPAKVRRMLRAEVNFGCPVPGCGSPFLSWHHFAPPWSERAHHEVEGMVALCPMHHLAADAGGFTNAQLRQFKLEPHVQDKVAALWPWQAESIVYALGGSVLVSAEAALRLSGRPLLATHRCERGNGPPWVAFDMDLHDLLGRPVMQMRQNDLIAWTSGLQDLRCTASASEIEILHVSGQHVKLRFVRYDREDFARRVLEPAFADKSVQCYAMRRIDEAVDSDGRVPVVHISGRLRTRDVSVSLGARKTSVVLHSYGEQSGDMEPKFLAPGARLRIEQAGLGELVSFG